MRLIVRQGMTLVGKGLVVGLAGAYFATDLLSKQLLFGVTSTDPVAFVTVPLLLLVAALGFELSPVGRGSAHRPATCPERRLTVPHVIKCDEGRDLLFEAHGKSGCNERKEGPSLTHGMTTITLGTPTLIGLPFDASSSYQRGPASAPAVIREALWSPSANSWTELGVDIGVDGAIADAGDLPIEQCAPAVARIAIERGVAQVMAKGARPVSLGGDHSVTYPVLRAVRQHAPQLTIVHIDAHPDLYDEFEGDRFSHACPFARIMDEKLADRLIQVGIRTATGHQRAQAKRFGVEVIEMRQVRDDLELSLDGPVYISIDIDALDPAFAPGVSHREPGGLSMRQLLSIVQSINVPIIGADVVELNPRNDSSGVSAMAAAKILRELLGVMVGAT